MEEQKRGFTGVFIPKELYLAKELTWTEKILYLEIDALSKNKKGCYAGDNHFARFIGVKIPTIKAAIGKLKTLKLIQRINKKKRTRWLETLPVNLKGLKLRSIEKTNSEVSKNIPQKYRKINPISNTNSSTKNISSKEDIKRPSRRRSIPSPSDDSVINSRIKLSTTKKKPSVKPRRKEVELFNFWNSLRIVKHKKGTKTYFLCMDTIGKSLKKYSSKDLFTAMKNYSILLRNSYFYNKKYSLYDFLTRPRKCIDNLFSYCLDGSILKRDNYMGKKFNDNGFKLKKPIKDSNYIVTKIMAVAFANRFNGGSLELNPKNKDYVYFMDGGDIVKIVWEKGMGYWKSHEKVAKEISKILKNFFEDNKEYFKSGVHCSCLSSSYFVPKIIEQLSNQFPGREFDFSSVVPGKYKQEYLRTDN